MTRSPAGKDALTNGEIPYIEPLGLDPGQPERANVRGGANAWGPPLDVSGARRPLVLIPMMILELEQASHQRSRIAGGGVGQPISIIVERM